MTDKSFKVLTNTKDVKPTVNVAVNLNSKDAKRFLEHLQSRVYKGFGVRFCIDSLTGSMSLIQTDGYGKQVNCSAYGTTATPKDPIHGAGASKRGAYYSSKYSSVEIFYTPTDFELITEEYFERQEGIIRKENNYPSYVTEEKVI